MERFGEFDYYFDFECTPFYIIKMMNDREDQVVRASDFLPDFFESLDADEISEDDSDFKVANSDFICSLLYPSFLRSLGYSPLQDLKSYKIDVFEKVKSLSPELTQAQGKFRLNIQRYLNDLTSRLYFSSSLEESKDLSRELLNLAGLDFDLGLLDEFDLQLYSTSYTALSKVLFSLGLFDPEKELRNGNFYLKKVPPPNGWDFKTVLESIASSIMRLQISIYESYKSDDGRWVSLMDEAERLFNLGEAICERVPGVVIKNNKGELWRLDTRALYYGALRKSIKGVFLYFGEDPNFWDFLAIPDYILSSRAVYKPWRRVR
jgi:hypothetical protein